MAYSALPDHRMGYDNDGTQTGHGTLLAGVTTWLSQAQQQALQDTNVTTSYFQSGYTVTDCMWWFFTEQREVTAFWANCWNGNTPATGVTANYISTIQGSNNTTNGNDGTWETASLPGGAPTGYASVGFDIWRNNIKAISFTGPKQTIRLVSTGVPGGGGTEIRWGTTHLYGERAAGAGSGHDLVFIDHDTTPGVEFTASEDFGDRPLGTTVTRQFRIKNVSATRTATNINIQCNDSDFVISTDNVNWVVTINIASLGTGAESVTMYCRNTTPGAGNLLGPRFARIVVTAEDGAGGNFYA